MRSPPQNVPILSDNEENIDDREMQNIEEFQTREEKMHQLIIPKNGQTS